MNSGSRDIDDADECAVYIDANWLLQLNVGRNQLWEAVETLKVTLQNHHLEMLKTLCTILEDNVEERVQERVGERVRIGDLQFAQMEKSACAAQGASYQMGAIQMGDVAKRLACAAQRRDIVECERLLSESEWSRHARVTFQAFERTLLKM